MHVSDSQHILSWLLLSFVFVFESNSSLTPGNFLVLEIYISVSNYYCSGTCLWLCPAYFVFSKSLYD